MSQSIAPPRMCVWGTLCFRGREGFESDFWGVEEGYNIESGVESTGVGGVDPRLTRFPKS